ncbi:hypothetical protein V8E52_004642 [Russula decolorans]
MAAYPYNRIDNVIPPLGTQMVDPHVTFRPRQDAYPRNVDVQVTVPPATSAQVPPATSARVPLATAGQADSENDSEMWNMYLDEVKEEDKRIIDAWKDDANSLVTFTGLFSAIVGTFIIEFYKKLSSDSGDQTVALLQQISHQLPNSQNIPYSNTANQPSPPGTAMVWVNALWLISLVLSLTCALIATLLQQWARRYIETPKSPNILRHRARVRSLLLFGTRLYKIHLIVEILPTLLHLSVYLFLGGLVITFHTINRTVAIAVDVAVGVSGLAYIALSIVPCLDVRCLLGLHGLLKTPVLPRRRGVLFRWLRSRGFSVSNHWRFLTDGLETSIVHRAVETRDEDHRRVSWLFSQLVLGDKDKFLKFAASIPRNRIPDLIQPMESVSFRDLLLVHLRGFATSRNTARYNKDDHERSLLAKALTVPDLNFMWAHFANTGLMRSLRGDINLSIRITSRSICALVARQVVRKQPLKGALLSWLQEVTGESSMSILEANLTELDQMIFKYFVIGALSNYVPSRDLSTGYATSLNETLAILLGVRIDRHDYFATHDWQIRLSSEVGRIQRRDRQEVFNKLLLVFPSLPPVTSAYAVVSPSHIIPPRAGLYRNIGAPKPTGREVGAGSILWGRRIVCPVTMSTVG